MSATKGPHQHTCTRRPGYFKAKTARTSCADNTWWVPSSPSHQSHTKVTQSSSPLIKKNLQSKYEESVRPLLTDNNPTPYQTKTAQNNIHTNAVQDAIINTHKTVYSKNKPHKLAMRNSPSLGLTGPP